MQIRSSLIDGELLTTTLIKTANEILRLMLPVFGHKGTDIFIEKEGYYLTRDGKEVYGSLVTDNVLSNRILSIIGESIYNQASIVGDGTTTTAIMMAYVIIAVKEHLSKNPDINLFDFKKSIKSDIDYIIDLITRSAEIKEFNINCDYVKSLLYTTTNDLKIVDFITKNITEMTSETLIDVILNEISSETEITTIKEPKLPFQVMTSIRPIGRSAEKMVALPNTITFMVDGALEITDPLVFQAMSYFNMVEVDNIIIFASTIVQKTTESYREFMATRNKDNKTNIILAKIPDYIKLTSDEKEDLSIILNGTDDMSFASSLDFQYKLYQAMYQFFTGIDESFKAGFGIGNPKIDDSKLFELEIEESVVQMVSEHFGVCKTYNVVNNFILMPENKTKVYNDRLELLQTKLRATTSPSDQARVLRRLSMFNSSRIVIKVGSELLPDAQRDRELILDGMLALKAGMQNGIILGSGLNRLMYFVTNINSRIDDKSFLYEVLQNIIKSLPINHEDMIYFKGEYHREVEHEDTVLRIVEPVISITNILKSVSLAVDIACSAGITVKNFQPLNKFI
jgi:hypothetical protein